MFNKECLMSSKRMDWKTPKALYQALNNQFNFDFDPCPPFPTFDGLQVEWGKINYVNPPYGTQIKNWVRKAWREAEKGKIVVMLIPSRTDTTYWHDFVMKANEIWFIKGRLKFDDQNNPAPFPSAIVVFDNRNQENVIPKVRSVGIVGQILSELI